jgi:hypothetical protein
MFEFLKPKKYTYVDALPKLPVLEEVPVRTNPTDYKLLYQNQRTITKCLVQACLDILSMAELKAQGDDVYLTRCSKVREAVNKAKEMV